MTNYVYIVLDCEVCATNPFPAETKREHIERMALTQQRCVAIPAEYEWKPCAKCGKPSSHTQMPDRFLCCECYIGEGQPPADWHPGCIKAFAERKLNLGK